MKQEIFQGTYGLPDAPLAMPKQSLERNFSLRDMVRSMFLVWQRR